MYDSEKDTREHIQQVHDLIDEVMGALVLKQAFHDLSKLRSPEKEIFDEWTPKLAEVSYGSPEYHEMLKQMKPAIDHHYSKNSHHPEHHPNGILGMNLVDLMEMVCDWKAATMRHADGDVQRSLKINARRFNMSPDILIIIQNTLRDMGWLQTTEEMEEVK